MYIFTLIGDICENVEISDIHFNYSQLFLQWTPCSNDSNVVYNISIIECATDTIVQAITTNNTNATIDNVLSSQQVISGKIKVRVDTCNDEEWRECYAQERPSLYSCYTVFIDEFIKLNNTIRKIATEVNETILLPSSIDFYEQLPNLLLINEVFYGVNASGDLLIIEDTLDDVIQYSIQQFKYFIHINVSNALNQFGRTFTLQEVFISQSGVCGRGCVQRRGQKYIITIEKGTPLYILKV